MGEARNSGTGTDGEGFVSTSPFGEKYTFDPSSSSTRDEIDAFLSSNEHRKVVVIQGLGFVGFAMLTAVAAAIDGAGKPKYAVIGIDLANPGSYWKVAMVQNGELPLVSADKTLEAVFAASYENGNVMATTNPYAYEVADIIVVDINLDVKKPSYGNSRDRVVVLDHFKSAIKEIGSLMSPSCLVVVETTVPPGTCERIVLPILGSGFAGRGLDKSQVKLAHSYERVMPGKNYLASITSFYRVYSGINDAVKREVREFLESFIDTDNYPLTELACLTASEMGKVLENSYRAQNIAFIQEWTEFAEAAGVNLFEVIQAIRKRDTHRNIMLPGFGVGGYCLPKDPILADWSFAEIFSGSRALDMSLEAVNINDLMPLHSFRLLKRNLGDLSGKYLLLLGVSYLNDIADTRNTPSEVFYSECKKAGANIRVHDPFVGYWPELALKVENSLEPLKTKDMDAVILGIKHEAYYVLTPEDLAGILKPGGLILDCVDLIDDKKADELRGMGFKVAGVGKGHWNVLAGE